MEDDSRHKEQTFLQRIRDIYPHLHAETTRLIDAGEFNDILVVNDALIFRFPRSPDGIERLKAEIAILEAIQEHVSLPIPNPRFVSKDMYTVGTAFVGYRMLPGEPLRNELPAFHTETVRRRLAYQLATFLRELHSFPRATIGVELPVHDRNRREALPGTYDQIREHLFPRMRPDACDLVTDRFDTFLSDPASWDYERAIKHGDLGPGNILVDPKTLSISGILDFGSAGLGDPAIDLGFVSFWGKNLLGSESFVEQLYSSYPVTEALARRVQFYRILIPFWVALDALQSTDRETLAFALTPYT